MSAKNVTAAKPEALIPASEFELFKNCKLKEIDTEFKGNQIDIDAQFRLYQIIVHEKLQNFTVQAAYEAAEELAEKVIQRVRGVTECNIIFDKGKQGKDTSEMTFSVKKANFYFMYPFFGYM